MTSTRGRGYNRGTSDSPNAQALRRPAEAGVLQRLENLNSSAANSNDIKTKISEICENLSKVDVNSEEQLSPFTDKIKKLCQSVDDMEKCIENIFEFAVKSKWNAHVAAVFCGVIGELDVDEAKFRTLLLRRLQTAYKERNRKYLELDSFLMEITFFCEIYYHVRIEDKSLKVLSRPIGDYFEMLIDGASQKEIEIFAEQFPKCYASLKEYDPTGLETIKEKLRKQIICGPSSVIVRTILLQMFESILVEFSPLNEATVKQYESFSKPILRICN